MKAGTRLMLTAAAPLILSGSLWAAEVKSAAAVPEPRACIEVKTPQDLQSIRDDLKADYCLANDIDMSGFKGFRPIAGGRDDGFFDGSLDGRGHVVRDLLIEVTDPEPPADVGLFGKITGRISNLRLEDVEVHLSINRGGVFNAGTIAGAVFRGGSLENCSATGSVTADYSSGGDQDISNAGGLAGYLSKGASITNCTANVAVKGPGRVGGLVGYQYVKNRIHKSSASGRVTGGIIAGGLAGFSAGVISLSYATGPVSGILPSFDDLRAGVGGLVGNGYRQRTRESFATGEVRARNSGARIGGLVGNAVDGRSNAKNPIRNSFALGPVRGMGGGFAGGAVGRAIVRVSRVYATGEVSGGGDAEVGGLTAFKDGKSFRSYWDTETTGQAQSDSPMELPRTTNQLQRALPEGFNPEIWSLTPDVSYPYLLSPDLDFAGPLAAVVRQNRVYIFVPIAQRENVEYAERPEHPNGASRAAVYTTVARAIGFAEDVEDLKEAKIDDFWDDENQETSWSGPVTEHAELGEITPLEGNIGEGDIIGLIRERKLVALRGSYTANGETKQHWMLATSFTVDGQGDLKTLVANDPWTGKQVQIDPETKKVVAPENFPLDGFKVEEFLPITLTAGN